MLVIAAAVATSMMMASPVMADDFKVGICNYVDDASLNQIVDNIQSVCSPQRKEPIHRLFSPQYLTRLDPVL